MPFSGSNFAPKRIIYFMFSFLLEPNEFNAFNIFVWGTEGQKKRQKDRSKDRETR